MLGQPAALRLGRRGRGGVQVAAYTPIYIPSVMPDTLREAAATYALNGTIRVAATPLLTVS